MVDSSEFDRWRRAAADALLGSGGQQEIELYNWACFLAEQSAQLAVKGLLHGIGAGARGHDLVALAGQLEEHLRVPVPEELSAAFRRLSRHYIPTRYPDAAPGGSPGDYYGETDARTAREDAEAVLRFVDSTWSELLRLSLPQDGS